MRTGLPLWNIEACEDFIDLGANILVGSKLGLFLESWCLSVEVPTGPTFSGIVFAQAMVTDATAVTALLCLVKLVFEALFHSTLLPLLPPGAFGTIGHDHVRIGLSEVRWETGHVGIRGGSGHGRQGWEVVNRLDHIVLGRAEDPDRGIQSAECGKKAPLKSIGIERGDMGPELGPDIHHCGRKP